MRVISGFLSGRISKIKLPSGIRPTKDSVKESVFNILENYIDFDSFTVADICAGSGSLGIEALSRGAGFCKFIDIQKQSIDYIEKHVESFQIDKESVEFINDDAISHLQTNEQKYDLMFFDPPYKSNLYSRFQKLLANKVLLKNNGIIVVEMPFFGFFKLPKEFKPLKEKINGETKIIIAKYQTDD